MTAERPSVFPLSIPLVCSDSGGENAYAYRNGHNAYNGSGANMDPVSF